jgi:hypothetical protein
MLESLAVLSMIRLTSSTHPSTKLIFSAYRNLSSPCRLKDVAYALVKS